MHSRRLVTLVGLTIASGALLVACAGSPRVDTSIGSLNLGLGPLPFRMPALHAPVVPVDRLGVLVNEMVAIQSVDPLKTNQSVAVPTTASAVTTPEVFGGCLGH
jgi:hypothetical protein